MTPRLLFLATCLSLFPLAHAAAPPPDILKTDLMVVVAHPDDEGMAAAVMTRYALGEGKTVASIHATRGEGGGNEVGTQLGPALGQLREAELKETVTRMGVKHFYFLDEEDWAYTESAAATLQKWGHDDALGKLVRLVRNLRPEVIVTFMPAPTGGQHGHHQTAGLLATEAFEAAADPAMFPDQLKREGLRPWQTKRLFYVGEYDGGPHVAVKVDGKAPDGRAFAEIASEAESHHLSQGFGGFGAFRGPIRPSNFTLARTALPLDTLKPDDLLAGTGPGNNMLALLEPETYRLAPGEAGKISLILLNSGPRAMDSLTLASKSHGWDEKELTSTIPKRLNAGERWSGTVSVTMPGDVKAGTTYPFDLEVHGLTQGDQKALNIPLKVTLLAAPTVEAEVLPLPAIARYRDWTRAQKIESFANALPSWVPFAAGQPGTVRVKVSNRGEDAPALRVRLALPVGWSCEPVAQTLTLAGHKAETLDFQVAPPVGAKVEDVPFKAEVADTLTPHGTVLTTADALAQVTPYAEVSRVSKAPVLDGDLNEWMGAGIRIPSSNVVQGQFRDDADGSAIAYLAYDDQNLYVAVQVKDDAVVSNIAPDDIKAHWRTDSVELTVDPRPRSESTLTTFKVGIFPWDTAGHVRAARDADSNQGPIEETAPGMKLASKRTDDGYIIETAIPWSAIGAEPKGGMSLGFNLILYDGDQKDARVGDGIGKGRLAWSPRPGVWGRPEQWGEIQLK